MSIGARHIGGIGVREFQSSKKLSSFRRLLLYSLDCIASFLIQNVFSRWSNFEGFFVFDIMLAAHLNSHRFQEKPFISSLLPGKPDIFKMF